MPEETKQAAAFRGVVRPEDAARVLLLVPSELRAGDEILGFCGAAIHDLSGPLQRYLDRGGRGLTVAGVSREPNGWLAMSLREGRQAPLLLDPGCRVMAVQRGRGGRHA